MGVSSRGGGFTAPASPLGSPAIDWVKWRCFDRNLFTRFSFGRVRHFPARRKTACECVLPFSSSLFRNTIPSRCCSKSRPWYSSVFLPLQTLMVTFSESFSRHRQQKRRGGSVHWRQEGTARWGMICGSSRSSFTPCDCRRSRSSVREATSRFQFNSGSERDTRKTKSEATSAISTSRARQKREM